MEAAAHGNSTLGIPSDVGEEFSQADKGKKFGSFTKAMQHHGAAKSDDHKRHPATGGYKMGTRGNRFGK
jgi:hypothetical protein